MNIPSFNHSPYPDVLPGLSGRVFGGLTQHGYAPEITGPVFYGAIKLATHDEADLVHGWNPSKPIGLNVTVLVPNGTDTSAVMTKLVSPFHAFGAAQVRMAQEKAAQIKVEHRAWRAQMSGIENNIAGAVNYSYQIQELTAALKEVAAAEPKIPEVASVMCGSATLKGLLEHFKRWHSAGVWQCEGAALMGRTAQDLAEYIKLIDGDPYQVYRDGIGGVSIPSPRLALAFVMPAERYLKHREVTESAMVDSGFDARFIFSVLESQQSVMLMDSPALQGVLSEYNQRVEELLWQSVRPGRQGPSDRRLIKPSAQAEGFLQRLDMQMLQDRMGVYRAIDGYAARHAERTAQLSASLAVFEGLEGDIPLDFVERAEAICRYHLNRYSQYFSVPIKTSKEMADAQHLENALRTLCLGQRPKDNVLKKAAIRCQAMNGGLNGKRFHRAFELLCERGVLQAVDWGTGTYFRFMAPLHYPVIPNETAPRGLRMVDPFQM